MQPGLVSISFRGHSPAELISAAKDCGLSTIEWGSDIHAPFADTTLLTELADGCKQSGIRCCSYGTYYRIGENTVEDIFPYIRAAKILGTNVLRLWCGNKGSKQYSPAEQEALFAQCQRLAEIAQKEHVYFCMECHNGTFTDYLDSALTLMRAVNNPHFAMYWQPNQLRTFEDNLRYAKEIAPYVHIIHAFCWDRDSRYPLANGMDHWREYLKVLPQVPVLLEFMPDDQLSTLPQEAKTLHHLLEDNQ